jgi:pSer/pThr/pTyr-binding forkhead associated (FHA) protein
VAPSAAPVMAEAGPPLCCDPSCQQPLPTGALLCLYCGTEVTTPRLATVLLLPNGDRLFLHEGEYIVLGRDPATSPCAHAFARYGNVSGRHAEIRATAEGFSVTDLRSTNGTRIDESPVPNGGSVQLCTSGTVRLGADAVVHVLVRGIA